MTYLRSNLPSILPAVLIWTLALALPWPALAQGLEVEFPSTPLFEDSHLLPGDRLTREVVVQNTGEQEQQVLTEAINEAACSDGRCLAEILILRISSDRQEHFSGSLAEFYAAGEVKLGDLPAGGTRSFDYTVSFPAEAPDGYQQLSTGFDLLVGFQGGEGATDQPSDSSTRGSIAGGGLAGLLISGESDQLLDPDSGSVEISWRTSYPATSQVIYGPYEGGPYKLDLEAPSFGYPSATPEVSSKTVDHRVLLSDLSPGRYRYRVVSHASPASISREYIFTVPGADDGTAPSTADGPRIAQAERSGLDRVSVRSAEEEGVEVTDETGPATVSASDPDQAAAANDHNQDNGRLAAVAGAASLWLEPLLWTAALLLLFILILRFWRQKQD